MHILLFHDSLLPPKTYGGIERIVVTLAERYTQRGHKVSVLCKKGSNLPGPLTCFEVPEDWDGERVESLIPDDVDFIHSHQPLRQRPQRPYLISIHGNGHPEEKYHPNTCFLSQSHAKNHNSKIFVFNGVDTRRYTFQPQKGDYFIFLARTTWRVKNLKTALQWAKDLNLPLKIIGGHGISRGKIEYLGFVDDEVKNAVLGRARALIYPTNWDEPCAGAPLEALSCGTPVIATANGCMPEMVDNQTGVICQNYQELLQAPRKLESISPAHCRRVAEEKFSVERMADDYLALFEQIVKNGDLVPEDKCPHYNFNRQSVQYMYKPTLKNKLRHWITGKI